MKIKLISAIIALSIAILSLVSCNYNAFDTNYTFDKAYVKVGEEWIHVDVEKWTDYEGEQIQLTLTDGTVMVVSRVNCILYNGTLPTGEPAENE